MGTLPGRCAVTTGMFASLLGAPALPGAKCRGRPYLFDEPHPGEEPGDTDYRQGHALRLCRTCPALSSCSEWFDALKPSQRPPGVMAGRVTGPKAGGRRSA